MPSTFMGLELAKRGISVHQQALNITGHNISNADNKNYARQRVNIESMNPLYYASLNRPSGPGMLGQGAKAGEIERIRDDFFDKKVFNAQQDTSYWETRQTYLHNLEIIVNEPSDAGINSLIDKFWKSWQNLSQYPEEMATRELVRTQAKNLTFGIRETFQRLTDLRKQADFDLAVTVNNLNDIATQITRLNKQILKSEQVGDNPNDLLDKRDKLIQDLSKYADITVEKIDKNEVIVYIGGDMIVQGDKQHFLKLEENAQNEGMHKIVWDHNNKQVMFKNGKIQSLLEMRDKDLKENIEKLDLLAVNIKDIVNEVHRDGFGLTKETNIDFFHIDNLARNINANVDLNGDGINETTSVFKMAGKNSVISNRPIGISGTLTFHKNDKEHTPVYITYRPDETLNGIIKRINRSGSGVVSYINHNNNLVLKGTTAKDDWQKNFMIRHVEDSGELLTGFSGLLQNSGNAGAFDYRRINEVNKIQSSTEKITLTPSFHPAASLTISNEIAGNIALIAATSGKDVGGTGDVNQANGSKDGSNALRIAQALKHKNTMVGSFNNTKEFYNDLVSKLGVESRTAKDQVENQKLIMKNLEDMRQSVMGVNINEEMANMVQFQNSFNASARILNTMNEMLARIINQLGA